MSEKEGIKIVLLPSQSFSLYLCFVEKLSERVLEGQMSEGRIYIGRSGLLRPDEGKSI